MMISTPANSTIISKIRRNGVIMATKAKRINKVETHLPNTFHNYRHLQRITSDTLHQNCERNKVITLCEITEHVKNASIPS